jgi:DNA ligase-1
MLAEPCSGIPNAMDMIGNHAFACEFKYDGVRAQIHRLEDGTHKVYSRHLEDQTERFPDAVENMVQSCGGRCKSYIVDCEIIAIKEESDGVLRVLPMQTLATRAKKLSAVALEVLHL